ncbi:SDR family oxidoreductase [Geodermatophilus marinus]|uniref:SDR family oxidoreductase n=1 Tax=Geodermatophilus sp. LHW52908 TaxID=2303986 RepID=UPI000E3D5408|nr:SDR family oxidoreductase [Geodermatophilus sp. LHW52908]
MDHEVVRDRFAGTDVLLTGAGSGIGRATALRLVDEGADVFAVDANERGLAATVAAASGPGRVVLHVADVSDEAAVVAAVRGAVSALDKLDGLDFGYYARIRSPLGPAQPEQIAATIAFAASHDASYLTGVDLRVDRGSHI